MDEKKDDRALTRQAILCARMMKKALDPVRSVRRTISLQLTFTFLQVAAEPGLTVTALAHRCGVGQTVMSRHLQDLGNINRRNKAGLGLVAVTQRVYGDRRERYVVLTHRGAAVARQMIAAIRPRVTKSPPKTEGL